MVPLGLQRNFAEPTQKRSTQAKHNQTTSPSVHVSAPAPSHTHRLPSCTHTCPTRSPTQRAPPLPCSLLRRPPPRLNCITPTFKTVGRGPAQPGRRGRGRGCGQQLVIARQVGSRLVVNGRKMEEGRGGAGRGSATWFRGRRDNRKERGGSSGIEEAAAGREIEGGNRRRKPGGVKVSSRAKGGPGGGVAGASISFQTAQTILFVCWFFLSTLPRLLRTALYLAARYSPTISSQQRDRSAGGVSAGGKMGGRWRRSPGVGGEGLDSEVAETIEGNEP